MVNLILYTLKQFGVTITKGSIRKELLSHPLYPTLSCVSDAFERWKVNHVIARLPLDGIEKLGIPVISNLQMNNVILITDISGDYVVFRDTDCHLKKYKKTQFEKEWSGISIIINGTDEACEKDYKTKKLNETITKVGVCILAAVLSVLMMVSIYCVWKNDRQFSLLTKIIIFIINVLGLFFSILLYRREKLDKSSLFDKFCRIGTYADCEKVTKALVGKYKIFNYVSDFAVAYFTTILLWMIFVPFSGGGLLSVYIFLYFHFRLLCGL